MEDPIITNMPLEEERPSRSWPKYGLSLIGILIIPVSYYGWNYHLSPEAREARLFYEDVATFQNIQNKFASDTYGGETPEETINLFVAALEKGDLELAAKYFELQTNGEQDARILSELEKIKSDGRIAEIVDNLKRATPTSGGIDNYSAYYIAFDKGGNPKFEFTLINGSVSKVWKLEPF